MSALLSRITALVLGLSLAACATLPPAPIGDTDFQSNEKALLAHEQWSLKGRLNVRQEKQADTVALNWQQQGEQFDLGFSSTLLGLGNTRVHGSPSRVIVEKAGEQAVVLPSLQALTREYLSFEFPAAYLVYWVRGLPVPNVPATPRFDEHSRLSSLTQRDTRGREWQLDFDRYSEVDSLVLPSRIKLATGNLQLTFLVDKWQFGTTP